MRNFHVKSILLGIGIGIILTSVISIIYSAGTEPAKNLSEEEIIRLARGLGMVKSSEIFQSGSQGAVSSTSQAAGTGENQASATGDSQSAGSGSSHVAGSASSQASGESSNQLGSVGSQQPGSVNGTQPADSIGSQPENTGSGQSSGTNEGKSQGTSTSQSSGNDGNQSSGIQVPGTNESQTVGRNNISSNNKPGGTANGHKEASAGESGSNMGLKIPSGEVTVSIISGDTSETVADKLFKAGLIKDREKFLDKIDRAGLATRIMVGDFNIREGASEEEIIRIVTNR